jgi:hypothetical protein
LIPVARYFLYVGGGLLALLFVVDALVPHEAVVASIGAPAIERPMVRIHSTQKLPERVVYDTSLPTIVPPSANVQVATAPTPPATALSAQSRVRDTFAQFVPEQKPAAAEPKQLASAEAQKPEAQAPKKRKIARVHSYPPGNAAMRLVQQQQSPLRVAQQQPHFGFFGMSSWSNTW